jgi:FKBP-type peptidyl-prolyl cis-trans isomerase FkpA
MKVYQGLMFIALTLSTWACLNTDDQPSFEEQFIKDLAAIDQYLEDNNIDAQPDPNNWIRYVIHEEGEGLTSPTLDNCVTTSYKGTLFNGNVFDQNESATFPLSRVIFGWQIGIPLLQNGDSATFYIPSGLAYGPEKRSGIPANSNLIFNVRLKNFSTYNAEVGSCN